MGATIYYFTGTGNSLKIARDMAEALDESKLVPLAKATEEQSKIHNLFLLSFYN